jgi:hypothetical protein
MSYQPTITTKLRGHGPNDLIIIYSKFEDLISKERHIESALGKYIPQWFGIDYQTETSGITIPADQITICTYEQMEEFGRKMMKGVVKGKIAKVLFYYSDSILAVNDMDPFTK